MNTADQIAALVAKYKQQGIPLSDAVWQTACACVGWPYVFGAWGAYCTTTERKRRYSSSHPTIYSACQVLRSSDPKLNCNGCKWYPNGQRVRCFDCRGFTDWCLLQFGIDLVGEGATSQWNNAKNWESKGLVSDGIPKNVLVCLFYKEKSDPSKMAHTGFGYNGATVECSAGVQKFDKMNSKWTHWAVPAGIREKPEPAPAPEPEPTPKKGYAIVTGKNLALREGPSTSAKVLTRLVTGTEVKIESIPGDWEYVKAGSRYGFVMKKFIKEG